MILLQLYHKNNQHNFRKTGDSDEMTGKKEERKSVAYGGNIYCK